MRFLLSAAAWALLPVVCCPTTRALACADPGSALGVSRIVEIDTSAGPIYGDMTRRAREAAFLEPKEVVLTFDDGPVPWVTAPILDTLDKFCTRATFFSVGEMALAYPDMLRDVIARGHTLGTHTWSHPLSLRRLSLEKATDQIERGLAAVALAAGRPIAPFFRFPGLSDSDVLLSHLQTRGIATFTVDVVSNDSYIGSSDRLTNYTLRQIEARQGGIVLFHDIKPATAKALPSILAGLKARGYSIVHLMAKAPAVPAPSYEGELTPILAKAEAAAGSKTAALVRFFGAVGPPKSITGAELPVTVLTPVARSRAAAEFAAVESAKGNGPAESAHPTTSTHRKASRRTKRTRRAAAGAL